MNNENKNLKYIYTEEARKLLPLYQDIFKKKLEEYVKRDKYTFGDEVVEITGSDVERVLKRISTRLDIELISRKKYEFLQYLAYIYLLLGVVGIAVGFFFDSIINIIHIQPQRIAIMVIGVFMLLISSYMQSIIKRRYRERRILLNRYYNQLNDR